MKNLGTWLVDRLQTVKRADTVTDAALPQIENVNAEAARYMPLHPKQNPMLATAFPRYTAEQGLKDIPTGVGRMAAETARAIIPGMGHQGGNSVGDNLINHGGRAAWGTFVGAPLEGVAGFARGIGGGKGFMGALDEGAGAYTKDLNNAWQPIAGGGDPASAIGNAAWGTVAQAPARFWGGLASGKSWEDASFAANQATEAARQPLQGAAKMFTAPFDRAMVDPNGMQRGMREVSGLLNRWQPQMLMGDTIAQRVGNTMPIPQWAGGGGMVPPFWRNWLGVGNGNWDRPATHTRGEFESAMRAGPRPPGTHTFRPGVAEPPLY